MQGITEEEMREKLTSIPCNNDGEEGVEDLTDEQVEKWLDCHEDFVASYFSRKASKFLLESFLRPSRKISQTSSPVPSGNINPTSSGKSTPARKISSSDFDKGYLKPIISHVDGIPSFLHFERSISRPSRRRKSTQELREMKTLNEQALLIELVHDIANDLDKTSLCHKILQNVSVLTDGDRCSLFLVHKYTEGLKVLVSKVHDVNADSTIADISANEEIIVPWGTGIVGYVAQTGETVNIPDAYADPRFNSEIDKSSGYRTNSLLCMPIKSGYDEDGNVHIIGVAQILNKKESKNKERGHVFTDVDERIFEKYLTFCGIGISNAQLFEQFQLELKRNHVLLDLARVIFEEQSSLHDVVHKIMMNTQSLIQCERCSVLLVDQTSKGLFSQAFDLEAGDLGDELADVTDKKQSCVSSSQIKFPVNIGITGYVATTGETLNIPDAYEDHRFDPSVDEGTNFKTKTVLCMPIKNSKGDIIGVVQLLNKMDGKPFNMNDENLFEAFSIFCGMAIQNTSMYEECQQALARQKVALDVLSYHATAPSKEVNKVVKEPVPTSRTFQLREFSFDYHGLSDHQTVLATLRMFTDLQLITRFRIDYQTLCSWVLSVKKNYRKVIYHNWRHAFNVTQSMFLILKEIHELKNNFSDEEKLALIVGCLCHDLDHRGTNNIFQVKKSSPLAQLYGTSVMEHHHFNHCIMIMHSSGNDILDSLSPEEYNIVIKVLEHAILATDLALYFKKRNDYFELVGNKSFQWEENEHKKLLRSMLMTACDLSAVCKPWNVQKRVAYLIAEEFFQQGDLELQEFNQTPIEMMDRAKKDKFPSMQVGYVDNICLPIYKHLSDHYKELRPMLNFCIENRQHWKEMAESGDKEVPPDIRVELSDGEESDDVLDQHTNNDVTNNDIFNENHCKMKVSCKRNCSTDRAVMKIRVRR